MKGIAEIPKCISDEEYNTFDKALQWFYAKVEDGGEGVVFDKTSKFSGVLSRKKDSATEFIDALENYENSPQNLNRIVNQHYTD